ncbi:MAG TPA: hypothetical protein VJ417_05460 [Candidatus Glassbacteria bacterium]|nr:hypothetical protein [Candidatus Glassbacteria bacterium]
MRKIQTFLLLALAAVAASAFAQADLRVGTWMLADNNIFRNYSGEGDVVFMPYADLGYTVSLKEDHQLTFGYTGDFYFFNQLSRRDFSVHGGHFDYSRTWPESQSMLALGAQVEARFNPEDYSYYNYTAGGFYANFKHYFRDDLMTLLRYNLNGRGFKEFPEFNYVEQVVSARANWFLPSRTTLSLSGNYYRKSYTTDMTTVDSAYVSAPPLLDRPFMQGRGPMWMRVQELLGTDSLGFYRYGVRAERFPSTDQLSLDASLAQNLAEGTGLMFGYTARINPHSRNRFLSNLGESVLNTEELFDDHYSYNSQEVRLQLRQLLPGECSLTLLASARTRRFSGREALDLEGNLAGSGDSRLDKTLLINALFTTRLSTGFFAALDEFDLNVQAGAGRNNSNDRYYDYRSAWFSVGLEKAF